MLRPDNMHCSKRTVISKLKAVVYYEFDCKVFCIKCIAVSTKLFNKIKSAPCQDTC